MQTPGKPGPRGPGLPVRGKWSWLLENEPDGCLWEGFFWIQALLANRAAQVNQGWIWFS